MKVSIRNNIDRVLPVFAGFSRQFKFAVALALTKTARHVSASTRYDLEKVFDRPTGFTKTASFFTPATKSNLTAVVGLKDKQAEYLSWNIKGGIRVPYASANKLPTNAPLNKFGNISRNYIRRMIEKADRQKWENKTQRKHTGKRRFRVKQTYFYGKPKGSNNRPAGIYLRTRQKGLISLVVFRNQGFQYHNRYDYYGRIRQHILQVADKNIREAWEYAKRTAR